MLKSVRDDSTKIGVSNPRATSQWQVGHINCEGLRRVQCELVGDKDSSEFRNTRVLACEAIGLTYTGD